MMGFIVPMLEDFTIFSLMQDKLNRTTGHLLEGSLSTTAVNFPLISFSYHHIPNQYEAA
jgi:hypothetical protein